MDLWSRKIVGYHAGDTLEADGALGSLDMALRDLPQGALAVHHSDRGCQYCSHRYVERLNGILKQEYELGYSFGRKKQALEAIDEGVFLYNTKRPHLGNVLELLDQTHSPKEPYIYYQGNNDLVHLGCL
jgi:transposase InsO family protein